MKKIYLIKAFDSETWHAYTPMAFETLEEADRYIEKNETKSIKMTIENIYIGKMP